MDTSSSMAMPSTQSVGHTEVSELIDFCYVLFYIFKNKYLTLTIKCKDIQNEIDLGKK